MVFMDDWKEFSAKTVEEALTEALLYFNTTSEKLEYEVIEKEEARAEEYMCEDADIIIAAYGTIARVAKSAIQRARAKGIKVGLIRPITLWPFPKDAFSKYAGKVKSFLSVEMSMGQMIEDVRLAVDGKTPVDFYGRTGGMIPSPEEIVEKLEAMTGGVK